MSAPAPRAPRALSATQKLWLLRILLLAAGALLLVALLLATLIRRDVPLSQLRTQYAPPPSRFVKIEGMDVHYRDEGTGAPIVLVHGPGSSLHTWERWAEALKTQRRVLRLDLPGHGLTGPAPDRDYRTERLARVLAKLLDELGIEQADLAGNSLGGQVAITFALAWPRRARRLILIAADGLSGQPPALLVRTAENPLGAPLVRWLTPRFAVRASLAEVYANDRLITEPLIDRYLAMTLRAGNRQALLDRVKGRQSPALDGRLKELRLPTLLQWGAEDGRIPIQFGQRMHQAIPGSELIVYPKAGHVPMEELPALTVRDATAFLESTDAEPSMLDVLEAADDIVLE
jgi:pimeloyl-ACP methyl ester carboxylesterase